ncbi:MAG TPA: hypothetical protein VIL48_06600, partial [Acidimicrobiales bacterium]
WGIERTGGGGGGREAPQAAVRPKTCRTYHLPGSTQPLSAERAIRDQLASTDGALVEGEWYYLECRWDDTGEVDYAERWQYDPADPTAGPSPETLARQAYDQVPLVVPQPRTAPPADVEQLVGFPIWLWVEPAVWRTFTAEATIPGLSVTVTATPRRLVWDMGDGTRFACAGPGTPWDPAGGAGQTTDCSHTYQFVSAGEPGGRYRASVTATWAVSWRASTGEAGTLADASRTATFGLTVGERQAIVRYGAG